MTEIRDQLVKAIITNIFIQYLLSVGAILSVVEQNVLFNFHSNHEKVLSYSHFVQVREQRFRAFKELVQDAHPAGKQQRQDFTLGHLAAPRCAT